MIVQMALCAQYQYVGLYAHTLQLFHAVLCGLGLQLTGSLQIRHVRQVYAYRLSSQFPSQLSDSLHKRCTLDVTDGAAHLGDDKVESGPLQTSPRGGFFPRQNISVTLGGRKGGPLSQHPLLDLIRDMRHHLNRLAQVVAVALSIYHRLIDATGCYRVVTCGVYARKSLVMTQVEIGFKTILRHIALAVLIGIQRTWIYVDVRVELLDGDFVATRLQQLSNACRDDALA